MNKLKNKTRFILFTLLFFSGFIHSQEWIKKTGFNLDDKALAATTDIQGNIYVTGYATQTLGGINFYTVKYSPTGQLLWSSSYDGPGHSDDKAFGIAVDRTGTNVYVTGYSTYQGNNTDVTTVKYRTSDGAELATNRLDGPSNLDDRAFGIAIDRISNVYIAGYLTGQGTGHDIYTVKLNPNLVFIWHKTEVGYFNGDDRAFGIVTDSLGLNIFVTGTKADSANGNDMYTVCYDSSGTRRWEDSYNGSGNSEDKAFGIAVDRYLDGGIYITGYTANLNSGFDYTTIKYNPATGDTMWVSNYNGSGDSTDKAFGIAVDGAGACFITGSSMNDNNSNSDIVTIKYSKEGDTVWTNRYSNSVNSNDSASSIVYSRKFQKLFVCGMTINDTVTNENVITIKYNTESGDTVQTSKIDMSPDHMTDIGTKVVTDTAGNIYIAGYTYSKATDYDFLTMKYYRGELVIGIQLISTEVPTGFALFQNYPNPFNPSTNFKFTVISSKGEGKSEVKITVYDILGRKVVDLLNDKLSPGTYEINWDASKFASGVYFYSMSTQDFMDTKKMVLVK